MDADRIITEVIQNTHNEFLLFFVLIIVAMVICILPLYAMVVKERKAKHKQDTERERQILAVIKENSTVIAGLKVTLDQSGASVNSTVERIHKRIDDLNTKTNGQQRISANENAVGYVYRQSKGYS